MTRQRVVAFPPGPAGVLLPRDDRRCAALGVTLYTASSPRALGAQWAAWFWLRLAGPRLLPGPRETITFPYLNEISHSLGLRDPGLGSAAVYRRRDKVRSGVTFVAVGSSSPPLLIKVRDRHDQLQREQHMLATIADSGVRHFHAPRPIGMGTLSDGRAWSAQEMVFATPHFPATRLNVQLLDELAEVLSDGVPRPDGVPPGWRPMHGDLTPWNLRIDHRGRRWLFDWEDAGYAPAGSDEGYFHAALGLIRRTRPMPAIPSEAAAFWIERVEQRIASGHPTENSIILERLRSAPRCR